MRSIRLSVCLLCLIALFVVVGFWPSHPSVITSYHYQIYNTYDCYRSSGSGIPISVDNEKFILTAFHIFEKRIGCPSVGFKDEVSVAELLYGDVKKDLLILQPEDDIIGETVAISRFVEAKPYDTLYAIGSPLEERHICLSCSCCGYDNNFISLSACGYPGFSGGGIYKYNYFGGRYYLVGMMQNYYAKANTIWGGVNNKSILDFIRDFREHRSRRV